MTAVQVSLFEQLALAQLSRSTGPSGDAAAPSSWAPPPAVVARGSVARVRENQGSAIDPSLMQGDRLAPGASAAIAPSPAVVAFRDWIIAHFPGFSSGGLGRSSSRSASMVRRRWPDGYYHRDVHEEGRAVDFMVRVDSSPEGEALANWLLANAEAIGVQGIVWRRASWYPTRTPHTAPRFQTGYAGESAHTDHVHAELSVEAAARTPDEMRRTLDALPRGLPTDAGPASPSRPYLLAGAAGVAVAALAWALRPKAA